MSTCGVRMDTSGTEQCKLIIDLLCGRSCLDPLGRLSVVTISVGEQNRKNIGYAALSLIYHELGLAVFFNNRSRALKSEYSVNAIMKLLVYYAIVTSELDKTDDKIIEIYRGLWKIEETFKVTKKQNKI